MRMEKMVLTLDEVLDRFHFKEWVQDELREVGLPTSGDKDELIGRFLNSKAAQRTPVDELGRRLVGDLRVTELKQIAEYVGSSSNGNRDQILSGILDTVVFEPFIKRVKRYCGVCSRDRMNELHFGVDWQADYFVCEVCKSRSSARTIEATIEPLKESDLVIPSQVANVQDDPTLNRATLLALALSAIGMVLAVSIPIALDYGLIAGMLSGIAFLIVVGAFLLRTRGWERWLAKRLQ